jgi:hypothetical protein
MGDNFVGNSRKTDYKDIMQNLMEHCKNLDCSMSISLKALFSHTDYFPQSLESVSQEYNERFHQHMRKWTGDLKMVRL